MNKRLTYILVLFLMMTMVACNRERNQVIFSRLSQWDSIVMDQPVVIKDSLALLNPRKLSRANRAYYGLLQTIVDDKTFTHFTSDSLINSVHRYYHRHGAQTNNHIRSLIYQSIVRTRIGITDSTTLEPLKEADRLYSRSKNPDINTGYFLYYYLGDVHTSNDNLNLAQTNFHKALQLANKKGYSPHIFDTYLALCWNYMSQGQYPDAKKYLDILATFENKNVDEEFSFLDTKAAYFSQQKNYAKALEYQQKQMTLMSYIKQDVNMLHFYYAFSNRSAGINQLDSALHYALLAVAAIKDSTYRFNYLIYENVADVAEKRHDYKMANDYRKKAAAVHEETIEQETNKRILELDKKYDLTEAENKALKSEAKSIIFLFAAVSLLLVVLVILIYYRRKQKIDRLIHEKNKMERKLLTHTLNETKQMVEIVTPYLQHHALRKQELYAFSNTIRAKNSQLADAFDKLLQNGEKQMTETTKALFNDDILCKALGTTTGLSHFNHSDRMLLFMLASEASNQQIAGMLNSTPENVKAKKSYLKKKIEHHTSDFNNPDHLLALFSRRKSEQTTQNPLKKR